MEALEVLTLACDRDTKNPQLHFQRAHILVAIGQLHEALGALHVVKEHAPKEPHVYALLGQVKNFIFGMLYCILGYTTFTPPLHPPPFTPTL